MVGDAGLGSHDLTTKGAQLLLNGVKLGGDLLQLVVLGADEAAVGVYGVVQALDGAVGFLVESVNEDAVELRT